MTAGPTTTAMETRGAGTGERLPALYLGHGAPPLLEDAAWRGELNAWAESLPRPLGEHSAEHVGDAAGCGGDNQPHRFAGIVLGERAGGCQARPHGGEEHGESAICHGLPSSLG